MFLLSFKPFFKAKDLFVKYCSFKNFYDLLFVFVNNAILRHLLENNC